MPASLDPAGTGTGKRVAEMFAARHAVLCVRHLGQRLIQSALHARGRGLPVEGCERGGDAH